MKIILRRQGPEICIKILQGVWGDTKEKVEQKFNSAGSIPQNCDSFDEAAVFSMTETITQKRENLENTDNQLEK